METGSLFVYKNERQVENMSYKITNAISSNRIPAWGNKKKYIAVHYLGVVGQNHDLASDGCGAHFYIYWDGTIYQRCSLDAVPWAVGTAGYYAQKHPEANNYNTISIEMCCKCDGNAALASDPKWYFTTATQEACAWLVRHLMGQLGIAADHVLRHYDIVNKVCPAPYVHNNHYKTSWTWNEFKKAISGQNTQPQTTGTQTSAFSGLSEKQAAEKLLGICAPIAKKNGLLPSVATAQCILESGYCRTELAQKANNICGMKCNLSGNTWDGTTWDGKSSVKIRTPEQDTAGNTYYINADFRKYPSIEKSIADRCAYLLGATVGNKKRYDGIRQCKTYREQITLIKNGGYATDIGYIQKICNIIERHGLDRQDGTGDILPDTGEIWYRVRKTWANAKSQIGAFHSLTKAKQCADQHAGYSVFDENGKKLYTSAKVPYKIKVTKTNVPIRTGAAKSYSRVMICPVGVYEIVEEKNGFGRLKSGAGWIYLKKTTLM